MTKRAPKPPKAPVLRLVESKAEIDVVLVSMLADLLRSAQAGRLEGLAYIATFKDHTYEADVSPSMRERAIFARGLLRTLEDKIRV